MLCIYIYIYILCIKQYISHTLYHHFIIYPDIVLYPIYKNYGRFLYLIFLHGENPKSKKKKTQARRMARRLEARSKSRSRPNFYGLEEVIQHFPGGETPWRVFHSIAAIFHGCFRCKSMKMMISWLSQYHLIKKFVLRVLAVDSVLYYRGFAGIPCLFGEVRQWLVWLFFVSTASRPTVHVLLVLMDRILQLRQWTSFLTMDDVIASISTDTNWHI